MTCKVYTLEDEVTKIIREYRHAIAHDCCEFVAQKIVEQLNLHQVQEEESVYDEPLFFYDLCDKSYDKAN